MREEIRRIARMWEDREVVTNQAVDEILAAFTEEDEELLRELPDKLQTALKDRVTRLPKDEEGWGRMQVLQTQDGKWDEAIEKRIEYFKVQRIANLRRGTECYRSRG